MIQPFKQNCVAIVFFKVIQYGHETFLVIKSGLKNYITKIIERRDKFITSF